MTDNLLNRTNVGAAMIAAAILLLGSGFGYRTLAQRYSRASESVPIPDGTLSHLAMNLNGWVGRDVTLSDAVVRATDTDAHINREYRRQDGQAAVSIFVAYGVRLRDLAPHRPEVCYPGAGWTLMETLSPTLALNGLPNRQTGGELPCRVYRFSRGGLDAREVTVLNYYIVDGAYCPDVSLLRSQAWRVKLQAEYAAQVQVACAAAVAQRVTPLEAVQDFAAVSAPAIHDLLERAVELSGTPVPSNPDDRPN